MLGSFAEGEPVSLETEYYGGREGPSRYCWYRQKNGGYDPIPGVRRWLPKGARHAAEQTDVDRPQPP